MRKVMGVVAALGGLLVLAGIVFVFSMVSTRNDWVRAEAGIMGQYSQNQNRYDQYVKTIREAAQIPEMYTQQLSDVFMGAMKARYGEGGSKAVFQFIQEQNPNVDPSLYTKLQQIIEAGRADFGADQKMLIDKKREYQADLRTFPNNVFAGILGFPTIDLARVDIVTSDETGKAFETKKSEPLQLSRPKVD